MKELPSLVIGVANGDTPAVLIDYLLDHQDDRAYVVTALTEPFEIVKFLFDSLDPSIAFQLPFTDLEKLELLIEHSSLNNTILFELACDFAEAVLPEFTNWNPEDHRPQNALDAMRRWIAGEIDDHEMRMARSELSNSYNSAGAPNIAVQTVSSATAFDSWADHCVGVFAARDTAKSARKIMGKEGPQLQLEICERRLASNDETTKHPEPNGT